MNKISRAIPPLTVGKRRSMIMTNRQCSANADTHRPQGFVQHRGTQLPPNTLTRHLFHRMPNRWSGAVLSATASGLLGSGLYQATIFSDSFDPVVVFLTMVK